MITISLTEALLLRDNQEKKIHELEREMGNSTSIDYKKEGSLLTPIADKEDLPRPMSQILEELDRAEIEFAQILAAIELANCTTKIDFTTDAGRHLTIKEAIVYIRHLRENYESMISMSRAKKHSVLENPNKYSNADDGRFVYEKVTVPNFNVKDMGKLKEKTEKIIDKIEFAINKANMLTVTTIDI